MRRKIIGWAAGLLAAFLVIQFTGLDEELGLDLDLGTVVSGATDAFGDGLAFATDGADSDSAVTPDGSVDVAQATETLGELTVKGKAPQTGYDRDAFAHWTDPDGNGCDARNDTLARDLTGETVDDDGCTVLSGTLTYEPYTGATARQFERGNSDLSVSLDAEHLVALGNAWISGAHAWDDELREEFANDPANLLMVDPSENRSKGAANAAEWLPPNKDFRCQYIAAQIRVKADYDLAVTQAEHDAMARVLEKC
ncbi:HNH endonuclease family protein [Isoptericola croceus]|uniref:HNH endonuclease family protein n=1 Tax=Isoptericola croceus TaxID=3031406 RepID=UPI0023F7665A|nr:HNH endonuclease family protein [Isoptericola croceus]